MAGAALSLVQPWRMLPVLARRSAHGFAVVSIVMAVAGRPFYAAAILLRAVVRIYALRNLSHPKSPALPLTAVGWDRSRKR